MFRTMFSSLREKSRKSCRKTQNFYCTIPFSCLKKCCTILNHHMIFTVSVQPNSHSILIVIHSESPLGLQTFCIFLRFLFILGNLGTTRFGVNSFNHPHYTGHKFYVKILLFYCASIIRFLLLRLTKRTATCMHT